MTRRHFLAGAAASAAAPAPPLLTLSAQQADRLRSRVSQDRAAPILRKLAAKALEAGPWSVAFHRPSVPGIDAGPNDYFSEGPYWWPDPKNPSGPYIRRDGERNPNRFQANRRDLGEMCEAVLALGLGACFLGDRRCGQRAAKVLSVWFLDPKTLMRPNLEYGQAVRGHNTGRGTGIIDTVSLIHAAQGLTLLEAAGAFDAAVAASVRQWYAEYLRWMTTSEKGRDEAKATNNHATWWTVQTAAFAALTGNTQLRRQAWDHYRSFLVPTQIRPDGSCPREEARTRSLSYSSMNLDGFAVLCRLAEMDGIDLWRFRTPAGCGVETSFHYLLPHVEHPDTWKKQQISAYERDRPVFPGLAGRGLGAEALLSAYRKLPRAETAWIQFVDLLVRLT